MRAVSGCGVPPQPFAEHRRPAGVNMRSDEDVLRAQQIKRIGELIRGAHVQRLAFKLLEVHRQLLREAGDRRTRQVVCVMQWRRRRGAPRKYSEDRLQQAKRLREDGMSYRKIGKQLNITNAFTVLTYHFPELRKKPS
jgi:hypothetical protein